MNPLPKAKDLKDYLEEHQMRKFKQRKVKCQVNNSTKYLFILTVNPVYKCLQLQPESSQFKSQINKTVEIKAKNAKANNPVNGLIWIFMKRKIIQRINNYASIKLWEKLQQ